MPSDFAPLFLFLGDRRDLRDLENLLRTFAQSPERTNVRDALPGTAGRCVLTLAPGEGPDAPYGLRPEQESGHYVWTLNAWQAERIAERIEALTPADLKSGNDILEMGIEGEIPVKVSRGEFTDSFLTRHHYLSPEYVSTEEI